VLSLNGARPSPISCGGAESLLEGGLAGLRPDMSHSSLPTGLRVCATVSHHSDVSDLQRRSLTLAAIAKVTRRQLVAKDDVIVQHMKGNWAGFVTLLNGTRNKSPAQGLFFRFFERSETFVAPFWSLPIRSAKVAFGLANARVGPRGDLGTQCR